MAEKLNMAIAGVGRIGVTHLATLMSSDDVCMKAIVEPNEAVGRKYAEQYHLDYYKSIPDLADRDDIQAIVICTPEEYHLDTAVEAAKIGKDIMIEKPLAKTYEECQEIIEAVKKYNVRLMVAHTCRSILQYRRTRAEFLAGKIGELCEVSIRRYAPRTSMEYVKGRVTVGFYIAIHDIDAIMWMTGHKITQVCANKIDKLNAFGEDGIDMLFRFDNGASGTMNMSWFLPSGIPGAVDEIDILGDKGVIRLHPYESGISEWTDQNKMIPLTGYVIDGKMGGAFTDQLNHFVDCILHDKEFRSPAEDVAYAVKVIEAVQRSMESGKPELV